MLVVCPNCATSYDVDIASLQGAGWRVCQGIWHAELPQATKFLAAADAFPVRRAMEAVTLTVAEEAARGPEAASAAASLMEPVVEPGAADADGQAGELACEQAPWDASASRA